MLVGLYHPRSYSTVRTLDKMHTLVEMTSGNGGQGAHVPAFLAKLWKLVDDPATNDLIYWSEVGPGWVCDELGSCTYPWVSLCSTARK